MRLLLCLTLLLLLPITEGISLREYYAKKTVEVPKIEEKTQQTLPQRERPAQFRPPSQIHRLTQETQNDAHRLVSQKMEYPYQQITLGEVNWTRTNRESIYHPIKRQTVHVSRLTDEEIKKLLIRPDVRNQLGLPALKKFIPMA